MVDGTTQGSVGDSPEFSFADYSAGIREIHHRVKNNLQVIVSLFGLQADRTTHPEVLDMLAEMQNRVRAIAYIHEPLYSSPDFSTIHFGEYLKTFLRELESFYRLGPRVQIHFSSADLAMSASQAVPLALISNELISNALKHAFPNNRSGTVSVALRYGSCRDQSDRSQVCELHVFDDGIGLPEGVDLAMAESMGLYLVRVLTQQLQGSLTVKKDHGTSISIFFPLMAE